MLRGLRLAQQLMINSLFGCMYKRILFNYLFSSLVSDRHCCTFLSHYLQLLKRSLLSCIAVFTQPVIASVRYVVHLYAVYTSRNAANVKCHQYVYIDVTGKKAVWQTIVFICVLNHFAPTHVIFIVCLNFTKFKKRIVYNNNFFP